MINAEYSLTPENAQNLFLKKVSSIPPSPPPSSGRGIIICAGGPYVTSAYVVVRLLRHYKCELPIEIWHAGADEIPDWAKPLFELHNASLHDITAYTKDRSLQNLRGFPLKTASIIATRLRDVLFLDADCFPVQNPEFLFHSEEYGHTGAIFFPDHKRHFLLPEKAIWDFVQMDYTGDNEFETGIFVIDKIHCWKALNLADWMNAGANFWYQHAMGDKDTFYLSWRKLQRPYTMAPPCRRFPTILTRHYWHDGSHIADHRTGTAKYNTGAGSLNRYVSNYDGRPAYKEIIDYILHPYVNRNFKLHRCFLREFSAHVPTSR
jgi:hypothetical protein